MKKQKISLGRLNLKKEHIADLNPLQQGTVLGGNNTINACAVTQGACLSIQIVCNSAACVTRIVAQCQITQVGPHCQIGPVTTTNTIIVTRGCPITPGTSVIDPIGG